MGKDSQWRKVASVKTQPIGNRTARKQVRVRRPKTENIIFIGSEMEYDLFWLKMMFVGAAYVFANRHMRKADRVVVAYVDVGYERSEKLAIEGLATGIGAETVALTSVGDVTRLLARARDDYEILDAAFFCHGLVGSIDLDYNGPYGIRVGAQQFEAVRKDAFSPSGRLYSYACRTGNGESSFLKDRLGFAGDVEAKPESSLAQVIANHFDVEVHAFLRRSYYGDVLRLPAESEHIAGTLRAGRVAHEGEVIPIPPEHEALPHPGLADSGADIWFFEYGPKGEGTNDYALWRKKGGRTLPTTAKTPKGLSAGQRVFRRA